MRRCPKWVLTLGLMAMTPAVSLAGPFDFLKSKQQAPQARRPAVRRTAARSAPPKASNQQVAEKVAAALRQARLSGYEMEIQYKNGVVNLKGFVPSERQRAVATQVASRVQGIKRVDNQLTVVPSKKQPAAQQAGNIQRTAGERGPNQRVQRAAAQQFQGQRQPIRQVQSAGPPRRQLQPIRQVQAAPQVPPTAPPMGPNGPMPQGFEHASHVVYDSPHLPDHAWPSYASYPNYAQVGYPKEYSASAWPYIGPFYPYPQVPMGWRKAQLEWDDGSWKLNFRARTERWWWFLDYRNW